MRRDGVAHELENVAQAWYDALAAAGRALDADTIVLPAETVGAERRALELERGEAKTLLERSAAIEHVEPPWLPSGPVSPPLLGLGAGTRACIFDLDGVLTNSDAIHAAAWAGTLDPLLLSVAHAADRQFIPFDRALEYPLYFDGRPRLEGLRLFLAARGLRLAEGELEELAERKGELLERGLVRGGVACHQGARRYLQAGRFAHLGRAVVSASRTTTPMLELADLQTLVDVSVDASTIAERALRSRPAPDMLLEACSLLGVEPGRAVSLTHSGAGVVAARAAGIGVVGVAADAAAAARLADFGAERVVPTLAALIDPRLQEGSAP
ncbi:MAG TPA: HAD family hydrolase [Gaiellaceae bacterium]|nr:HAD family hydrolase [Gaiellaceae bacterium]